MAHKGRQFGTVLCSSLRVKQIASANESPRLPPVGIHAINGGCALLAIHRDSLIDTLLVNAKVLESESHVLVFTFNDLDGVCIDLSNRADCSVGVVQPV